MRMFEIYSVDYAFRSKFEKTAFNAPKKSCNLKLSNELRVWYFLNRTHQDHFIHDVTVSGRMKSRCGQKWIAKRNEGAAGETRKYKDRSPSRSQMLVIAFFSEDSKGNQLYVSRISEHFVIIIPEGCIFMSFWTAIVWLLNSLTWLLIFQSFYVSAITFNSAWKPIWHGVIDFWIRLVTTLLTKSWIDSEHDQAKSG